MRYLDGLQHAAQFDLLVAPVELAGIARYKQQRHKRLCQLGTMMAGLPALHEPLHAVISAAVADFLQTFE